MYLAYVDESGDVGTINSPSNYFILSAIIFHENYWLDFLNDIINFRRILKEQYGLLLKEEIHAAEFINGHPKLKNVTNKYDKLLILKECLDYLNSKSYISVVTLRYEKTNIRINKDVFNESWSWFIQRIENTVQHGNFHGGFTQDKVILIPDNSDIKKLTAITRRMRRFNHVNNSISFGIGSRSMPLKSIIKDPIFRDSKNSYFHQMVDVVAYFARQYYEPNNFIKKKGAKNYYITKLRNVTNPHVTRKISPNNIVEV